jgi:type IV pilus assembly protein PilC
LPTFTYKTKLKGKEVEGEVEAENEKSAITQLRQKNIRVDKVKKKKAPSSGIFGPKKQKVTDRDMVLFTRQFSTMIDAGLPLVQCLDILGRQSENKSFGDTILEVKTNIEVGGNLSDSMRKYPEAFDTLYCNMVEAGEAGGILDVILQRLAAYIEKAASLKKKVKGAMVYPGAIVTVAFGVVKFLMIFVIPGFDTMFEGGGA